MANSTPNINLSLMKTGENVGTWGNVLNTNFLTIDSLLGEMKEGRGTYVNIADHLKSLTDSINSNNAAIIKTDGELTALKGTVTSDKEEATLVAGRVDVLEKKTFFRVNRRFIISSDCIKHIHTSPNYKVELQAQPAEEITVSRERVKDFKDWLVK